MGQNKRYNTGTTNQTKEAQIMKTAAINKMDYPLAPYPNAATRREVIHKILDHLLIVASCAGVSAVILLLITLA